MLNSEYMPLWLNALLSEKFFNSCLIHENSKKNEKNIFCLDCCEGICGHCLTVHHSHRLLQIRRYVYNDVLRVDDAQKLIDCSSVQLYTNNRKKVVFIKERPQTRPYRGTTNFCSFCDRGLQDPYLYCCLSCKLNHIVRIEGRLTKNHIFEFEGLSFLEPVFDDGLLTPDSVLEPAGSNRTESGSSGTGIVPVCVETAETVMREKRGRRKNTPHRSPLF